MPQRDKIIVRNDDMIDQLHAHGAQRVKGGERGGVIVRRGQRHAAGMVVRDHHAACAAAQRILHDLADIELDAVDAAGGDQMARQQAALCIETGGVKLFLPLAEKKVEKIAPRLLRIAENDLVRTGRRADAAKSG